MTRKTITVEVTESQEAAIYQVLALVQELEDLADQAPDGTVFDACEGAVVQRGREFQQQLLQRAVQRRLDAAEKRGAAAPVSLWTGQGESRPGATHAGELRRLDYPPAPPVAVPLRPGSRRLCRRRGAGCRRPL